MSDKRESPSVFDPAPPLRVARVDVHVLRWPVQVPVRTSFGTMFDRPAVLVRVEDADGAFGWGEAWCNFPACGAEHRARLIESVLAPLLVGVAFRSPRAAYDELTGKTAVLALQSGEPGPIAQAIAGVDIALHDLAARRAGLPLWRMLRSAMPEEPGDRGGDDGGPGGRGGDGGGRADGSDAGGGRGIADAAADVDADVDADADADANANADADAAESARGVEDSRPARHRPATRVAVYASGINPERAGDTVATLRAAGHTAFKLKVGFGAEPDLANLREVRAAAGEHAALMADANQAWDVDTAIAMSNRLAECGLGWLEEPLRADRPWAEWQRVAAATAVPLAAGENAIGLAAFEALIASAACAVVQPDVAKWGGISGVLGVVERIRAAGLRYCPHYLGAGIGLLASAHLLAAHGAAGGLLEVDSNENPLRELMCPPLASLQAGAIELADAPGLGVLPDMQALAALCRRPAR